MMAGNFQQMGNAGGNPMMMQQQQQQQNRGMADQTVQALILQTLRQNTQPQNLSGWQAGVPEVERMHLIWQLVTQLRLAQQSVQDMTKHCHNAIAYEKNQFEQCPDKGTYLKNLHGKLQQLTNARANNQLHQQQLGMANQAGAMGQSFQQGMQQLQNMQQMQQQMQPAPMQGQQQPQQMQMGGMANNMMGQNVPPNPQFQMNMQQQQQQQAQMQAQQGGIPKAHGQQALSPEDRMQVQNLVKQMMSQTPETQKIQMRQQLLAKTDPVQAERWKVAGIDPLGPYFQNQATRVVTQQKMKAQQMAGAQQGGQAMPMGMQRPQGAIPMQPQRSGNPNPMMAQPQQGQQQGMPGNPDFNFLDPQQNQNSQDANQLAMQPSLSQQGNTTPQNMAGLPVQSVTPNQQRMMNPQMRQQFNAQQQAALQVAAQERARKAQMAALQGQAGGMGPMPPNQSPAMNTLNAPLAGTPQQNAGAPGNAMGQAPSQFGQPIDARLGMAQRPGMNGQIALPENIPPDMRQKLQTLAPDKLNEVLAKWNHSNQQRQMLVQQNQQNGLAGGMPGGGQMMQNPGGAHPQPGIQGMANPMNQFMQQGGPPMQRPTPQMVAGMTPQQQAILRQQLQQRQAQQQQQMQNGGAPQSSMAEISQLNIDGVDFPQTVYTFIPRQLVPNGVAKWGPLKQWILAHGALAGIPVEATMEKLLALQKNQMAGIIRNRQVQAQNAANMQRQAQGLPPMPQQPGQQGPQPMNPAMMAQLAQLQAQAPPIGPNDIETARQHASGRWASLTDDQIRGYLLQQQRRQNMALLQRQQQQQQMQMQAQAQGQPFNPQMMQNMGQMPGQNMPNGMQRPIGPPQQQGQPMPPQGMKRPQPNQQAPPAAKQQPQQAQMEAAKQTPQQRAAKPNQPASSPAQPPNSKKRGSSDDVVEVPNPNGQVNRPQMQPGQPPFPVYPPEVIAKMAPEQRQKYMQAMAAWKQRQQINRLASLGPQPTQQDIQAFQKIRADEHSKFKPAAPVNMSPEEKNQILNALRSFAPRIQQILQVAVKWFMMTKDEARLRALFRAYFSINDQFEDGLKAQRPKAQLSMKQQDLQQAMGITSSILQDVANKHPELMKGGQRPGQPGQAQQPAQPAHGQQQGPAQFNAANLQRLQQDLSAVQKEDQAKAQMARGAPSGTKDGAPASAQPLQNAQNAANAQSLAAGQRPQGAAHHVSPRMAVNSPQGVPVMYGKTGIDQGQLKLPPSKKKKVEGGMTSSGNTPVQTTRPTPNQQQSQPMMKQESQNGQKPQVNGQQPQQEQPKQIGYICQDRDCEGITSPFKTEEELRQHREAVHVVKDPLSYLMGEFGDYLGLDSDPKTGATEMKKEASSMAAQPSPKRSPKRKAGELSGEKQESWTSSGVDPSVLTQVFKPLSTGALGSISNVDAYRSRMEDSPESSSTDNSKGSDPNSDITEGVSMEIRMEMDDGWTPFGESDVNALTIAEEPDLSFDDGPEMGGLEGGVINELQAPVEDNNWDQFVSWEEPDKPFSFHTDLFGMNDGSSYLN